MKHAHYRSYYDCVGDLLDEHSVMSMENVTQHTPSVNCLDHCLFVSYLTYRFCRFLKLRSDEAARGALLHDMFLYNQHEMGNRMYHLVSHPAVALENANARFTLSEVEQDAILNHMWPITPKSRPRSREAAVVCLMDKICAIAEVTRLYHLFKMPGKLSLTRYRKLTAGALA
jgi:uncharacterized protein